MPTCRRTASPGTVCDDTMALRPLAAAGLPGAASGIIELGLSLPEHSDILPLAEACLDKCGPGAGELLDLIRCFDEVIEGPAGFQ